jgi:hypothetical protein
VVERLLSKHKPLSSNPSTWGGGGRGISCEWVLVAQVVILATQQAEIRRIMV